MQTKSVGDAVKHDSNGHVFGKYKNYALKPVYQPIYTLQGDGTAKLTGYEGLIRPHIGDAVITPENFFPLISKKDALFVECLCVAVHLRGFKNSGVKSAGLFVNVNVGNYDTLEDVERELFYMFSQLASYGLDRNTIVFEILETEVTNPHILIRLCELIRTNGYKFALDDFGTSHSNIERYISVEPNIIKLDRSLFMTSMVSRETSMLLKSLIGAFQQNGVTVLMEGIETIQQMQFALSMKVDMLQGFFLGRPSSVIPSSSTIVQLPTVTKNTAVG